MSENGSPWADPDTRTEPGPAYAGPPPTGPWGPGASGYGPPAYGPPGYGPPAYGPPVPYGWPYGYPWGPPLPQGPRRPGQVIAAAVLAFVQAALVLLSTIYVFLIASVANFATSTSSRAGATVPAEVDALATEGTVLAIVQLVSAVVLIVAGILALNRRSRLSWVGLIVAFGVQILLAVYWAVRLTSLLSDVPGPGASGAFVSMSLFFAAPPVVGLGLVLFGPGRRWFEPGAPEGAAP